jgi:hypothetical protein
VTAHSAPGGHLGKRLLVGLNHPVAEMWAAKSTGKMSLTIPPPPTLSIPVSHLTYESTTEKKRVLGSALADRARRGRHCLAGWTRRSSSNAPKCWLPLPRRPWNFGWSGKPQPDADRAAGFEAGETLRQQRGFETYLPCRRDDSPYTFGGPSLDQRADREVAES